MNFKLLLFIKLIFFVSLSWSQNPINAMYAGEKDGDITGYYLNGQLKDKCIVKNGNIHGNRVCYYKNGKLQTQEQFDNGEYNGMNYCLTENGDTVYIEIYKHDTLLFTKNFEYYKNGKLKYESTVWFKNDSSLIKNPFTYKNGLKGISVDLGSTEEKINNKRIDREFYKSGELKEYTEITKNLFDGKYIDYYKNGQKSMELYYINGYRNGNYELYYQSGKLKCHAVFKDDKYEGEYIEYDEKGNSIKRLNYKNGKVDN